MKGKVPKQIQNTVGIGEIARNEQFLLFPQCFQRLVLQTRKNQGLFEKGLTKLKAFADDKFNNDFCLGQGRKHCEKRRKCWLPAFSLFLQCFQNLQMGRVE